MANAPAPVVATRVLRAGPPQGRKGAADIVAAVFGVLLLVMAGAFVKVLPQDKPIPRQFQVSVFEVETEFPETLRHVFADDARDHVFAVDVPDNVFRVTFTIGFEDEQPNPEGTADIPQGSTLPDVFQVQLFDHRGEARTDLETVRTADPLVNYTVVNPPDPLPLPPSRAPTRYDLAYFEKTFVVDYRERPQDEVVDPASKNETADEARLRLQQQKHIPTAGTWTVKVRYLQSGDCPEAAGTPGQPDLANRIATCHAQHPGAPEDVDTGNNFALTVFKYTTFELGVRELE